MVKCCDVVICGFSDTWSVNQQTVISRGETIYNQKKKNLLSISESWFCIDGITSLSTSLKPFWSFIMNDVSLVWLLRINVLLLLLWCDEPFLYAVGDNSSCNSSLLKHFHKHFPKQTVKMRYANRKPWLTQGIKDSIKEKHKLYKKYLKIRTVANETRHKTYRNKLHHILNIAEKQHYS